MNAGRPAPDVLQTAVFDVFIMFMNRGNWQVVVLRHSVRWYRPTSWSSGLLHCHFFPLSIIQCMHFYFLYACYVFLPCCLSWNNRCYNGTWRVQIIKLRIVYFFPSLSLSPSKWKYFSSRPVFSIFLSNFLSRPNIFTTSLTLNHVTRYLCVSAAIWKELWPEGDACALPVHSRYTQSICHVVCCHSPAATYASIHSLCFCCLWF